MNRPMKKLWMRKLFLAVCFCLVLTMTVTAADQPEADRIKRLEEKIASLEKLVVEFGDELAFIYAKFEALEDKISGKNETPSSAMTVIFKSVKFFESGITAPEISNRLYNSQFSQNTTRYVFMRYTLKTNFGKSAKILLRFRPNITIRTAA